MNYISTKEAAILWNVSERMVRLYCTEGRIPEAVQEGELWLIPADAPKPERKVVERVLNPKENLTAFANRIVYQRSKNNHYGIYEYIQLNLAYSSNRMASNRMTRNEIEEVYRTNKISTSFEPVKVDDIIEVINHFSAVRYLIDNITAPISQVLIKKIHRLLTYGTYADRKETIHSGEYRQQVADLGVAPKDINNKLASLIKEYEGHPVNMDRILDFHVRFEKIHPFEDYNGRVGRLIMMKECLRYPPLSPPITI